MSMRGPFFKANEAVEVACEKMCEKIRHIMSPSTVWSRLIGILDQISSGNVSKIDDFEALVKSQPPHIQVMLASDLHDLRHAIENVKKRPQKAVDVAILTALEKPELKEILELPVKERKWTSFTFEGEPQEWHHGTLKRHGHDLTVVAASPDQMGMPAMSVITTKAIMRWNPKLIILCGIAAGARKDTKIGDVLAPERIYVHDSGKDDETKGFLHDRWTVMTDPLLIRDLKDYRDEYTTSIIDEWIFKRGAGEIVQREVNLHTGPLASGNVVVNSKEHMGELKEDERKIIGLEMEGYAVLFAVRWTFPDRTRGLILKSVCDHGYEKGDQHQAFAAFTSARFAYNFLTKSNAIDRK